MAQWLLSVVDCHATARNEGRDSTLSREDGARVAAPLDAEHDRVICSTSAVLLVCPRLERAGLVKWLVGDVGAGKGTRTPDLLITSELLCQLSYPGGMSESIQEVSDPIRVGAARAVRGGAPRSG